MHKNFSGITSKIPLCCELLLFSENHGDFFVIFAVTLRMEGVDRNLLERPARPQQPRVDETLLEQTKGLSRTYDLEPDDAEYGDEAYEEYDETLGTGGFLGSLLLMSIPVVGLLIGLIWAFGGSKRVSRQKLAQAYLLFVLIAAAVAAACIFLFSSYLAPQMERVLTALLELIK